MNKTLIEENKAKLLAEQGRLRTMLKHQTSYEGKGEFPGDYKPKFTEAGNEQGENASEVEQFQNELSLTEDLEQRLLKIQSALNRIADGTYGKCIKGDDIEEERLRAEPAADTCMKHAK